MASYTCFHQLLRRDFTPLLRTEGFKGSGTTFRRILGNTIHVINIQGSQYGGQSSVNLGLHFSFLPTTGDRYPVDPTKLKEYECEFRDRLHESHESDHWWLYGATEADAEDSVRNLIEMYRRLGADFFLRFEPFPDVFEKITPAEMDSGDLTHFPVKTVIVRAALTMARIMNHQGHSNLCREFAEVGLRHLDRATALKAELKRLRDSG